MLPQDAGWDALAGQFTIERGVRQIFLIDVGSTQTSCGWAVPRMELVQERETLRKYFRQDDPQVRLAKYQERDRSIDGLPVTPPSHLPYS